MFKLFVIGAVVYFIFRQFGRESGISGKKSTPIIQSKPSPAESEQIEDIDYTEQK